MKKFTSFFLFLILISVFIAAGTGNQNDKLQSDNSGSEKVNRVAQSILEKKSFLTFVPVELFNFSTDGDNASDFVRSASLLKIKNDKVSEILKNRNENILFRIPVAEGSNIELELTQSLPLSSDFVLTTKNNEGNKIENYVKGLHYNGIIKGKSNSLASISIFNDFIMGVISDDNGNYNLGSIKNPDGSYSENYIYYNDRDLLVSDNFKCDVDRFEEKLIRSVQDQVMHNAEISENDDPARLPIKVYFETDFQVYLDNQSNTQNVGNFVSGMFNSVKTIYQNEGIPFEISQIGVWTVADPYRTQDDSYLILTRFGGLTRDDFQGNIGHLLSSRNEGLGGIAWIRVLCAQYSPNDSAGRFAFSNINPNYNNYPTYSWTINVVTHEMGHSVGSRHTHSCVWPVFQGGGIGAIDSCYNAEGGCFQQLRPRVGTIMSYCHLWSAQQGGGVNLAAGFGPFPGDTIRLRYNQAACLDRVLNSSEAPVVYDLAQNFPNPFNPSTVIQFGLPSPSYVSLKVYDVTGRLIADLIQNEFYDKGFHPYEFNSANYNLSSGIYFYRITASNENTNFAETKRMILVK